MNITPYNSYNNGFSKPLANKNSFMNTTNNTFSQLANNNNFVQPTNTTNNTFSQFANNNNSIQLANPEKIADNFIYEYYKKVSDTGWNTVIHLFNHKCEVLFKNKNIGNEHDLLNILSSELIKKAIYSELNFNWIVLSNDILMINVLGELQFISYINEYGHPIVFTETFILKHTEKNNIMCYYHILNF